MDFQREILDISYAIVLAYREMDRNLKAAS